MSSDLKWYGCGLGDGNGDGYRYGDGYGYGGGYGDGIIRRKNKPYIYLKPSKIKEVK